jgi:putative glutamine amidotransferase
MGAFSEHGIDVREGTRLESILGRRHGGVQSSHHQGVGRVGDGLVESAYADDGSLEAFEDPSKQFALGVLWHPEMEDDKSLFDALVAEARLFRAGRKSGRPDVPPAGD